MGYLYAAIWAVAGLVLIFRLRKENKIFVLAGAYFLVLASWWFVDALRPEWQVFAGVPGIVLKVVTGAALVLCAVRFYRVNRESVRREKEKQGKDDR